MTAADEPRFADPNPLRTPRDVLLRRYQLRDLAWCGICDLPLIAILVPPGARYYGCVNKHCARRLLAADVTEQRVWCRFVAINQTLADGIPRPAARRTSRVVEACGDRPSFHRPHLRLADITHPPGHPPMIQGNLRRLQPDRSSLDHATDIAGYLPG